MARFKLLLTSIVLAASTSATSGASATALVDGGFEARGAATPVTRFCYAGFAVVDPACAASAWTGGGVIKSGNGDWGGTIAAEGDFYGFVQGTSVLSQSFTATQSGTGTLTWFDANRSGQGGLQSYDVALFDGVTTTLLGNYTSAFGSFAARSVSGFFLTNGTNYTVSFTGLTTYVGTSDSDRTAFIDGAALSSVPEPSSWAMMLAGFGLVGFAARRRRYAATA